MPTWSNLLYFLAATGLSAVLFRLTYRKAYQRGYDAGRLDAMLHRPDPLVQGLGTFFTRLHGMMDGFRLGVQHANKEKAQNPVQNNLLNNLN